MQFMEPMTPEERFAKIENALYAITATQAQQDARIAGLIAESEKHTAAIRDLIIVSRTFLESQKEVQQQIHELLATQQKFAEQQRATAEQQRATEDKLSALIDIVDRIIRRKNL